MRKSIILLGILFLASLASAQTLSHSCDNTAASGSTIACSLGSVATNSLLTVEVISCFNSFCNGPVGTFSASDTLTLSWSSAVVLPAFPCDSDTSNPLNVKFCRSQIFYALTGASSGATTVTITGTNTPRSWFLHAQEWTGMATATPLDGTSSAAPCAAACSFPGDTTVSSGNATTQVGAQAATFTIGFGTRVFWSALVAAFKSATANVDLILGYDSVNPTTSPRPTNSIGTGFTALNSNSNGVPLAEYIQVVAASTAVRHKAQIY